MVEDDSASEAGKGSEENIPENIPEKSVEI